MKARDWNELELLAGIKRTEPLRPTQRDALNLRAKRLRTSPFWRRKK